MAVPTHGFLSPWLKREFISQRNTHGAALPDGAAEGAVKVQVIKSLGTTGDDGDGEEALVWTEVNDGEAWIACCIPQSVVDAFSEKYAQSFGSYCALKSTFRLRRWSFILARPPIPIRTMSPSKARSFTSLSPSGKLQSERLCLRAEEVQFLSSEGEGSRVLTMRGDGIVGEFRKMQGVEEWVRRVEEGGKGTAKDEEEKVVYDGELGGLPITRSARPTTSTSASTSASRPAPLPPADSSHSTSASTSTDPLPPPTDWSLFRPFQHCSKRMALKARLAAAREEAEAEDLKRRKEQKGKGKAKQEEERDEKSKEEAKENDPSPSSPPKQKKPTPLPAARRRPSPSPPQPAIASVPSSPVTFAPLDLPPSHPSPPRPSSPFLPSQDDLANADFEGWDLDDLPPSTAYHAKVGSRVEKEEEEGEEDEVMSQAAEGEGEGDETMRVEMPPTSDPAFEEEETESRDEGGSEGEEEDEKEDAELAALLTQPQAPSNAHRHRLSATSNRSSTTALPTAPPARQSHPPPRSSASFSSSSSRPPSRSTGLLFPLSISATPALPTLTHTSSTATPTTAAAAPVKVKHDDVFYTPGAPSSGEDGAGIGQQEQGEEEKEEEEESAFPFTTQPYNPSLPSPFARSQPLHPSRPSQPAPAQQTPLSRFSSPASSFASTPASTGAGRARKTPRASLQAVAVVAATVSQQQRAEKERQRERTEEVKEGKKRVREEEGDDNDGNRPRRPPPPPLSTASAPRRPPPSTIASVVSRTLTTGPSPAPSAAITAAAAPSPSPPSAPAPATAKPPAPMPKRRTKTPRLSGVETLKALIAQSTVPTPIPSPSSKRTRTHEDPVEAKKAEEEKKQKRARREDRRSSLGLGLKALEMAGGFWEMVEEERERIRMKDAEEERRREKRRMNGKRVLAGRKEGEESP